MTRSSRLVFSSCCLLVACGTPDSEPVQVQLVTSAPVVEVRAVDYGFVIADTIPSGWTTFHFTNEGAEAHFMLINRMPDGKTADDYIREVGLTFVAVWDSLRTGSIDKAGAGAMLGELIPEWYGSVVQVGGPGFLSPGLSSETTLFLEPGEYEIECYVKAADGQFHASLGMEKRLVVSAAASGGAAPQADATVTVHNSQLTLAGNIAAGPRIIAVEASEHPPYGLGNDVHLARLDSAVSILELARWMDWMELDGLSVSPPVPFLGGVHEMPVGQLGYFAVDLAPGDYALVTESTADRPLVHQFTVE